MRIPRPAVAATLALALGLLSALDPAPALAQPSTNAEAETAPARFVGSESCAGCHADETEAWRGSHHALAWTPPTAEHVLGDFDDARFEGAGLAARFRTAPDGGFRIEVTEADGVRRAYPVRGVAGIAPLQQYLLETEPGRLQSFDVAWDTERGRWFHLYPDTNLPPDDGLHWTGPYKTWNARCAECHATGFDKGYDPRARTYASTQAEIGVGCESCHGPGSRHADWAEAGADPASAPPSGGFAVDFDVPRPAEGAGIASGPLAQCAGCHARREAYHPGNPPAGMAVDDAFNLALLRPGLYHADGQILDEVYVWGSFLQSKMQAKGVVCTDCHDPHQAALRLEGNDVCAQCHSPAGNPEFPSLARKTYDDPAHHFHAAGSEGAQCVNCHMIERDYMQVDGRRDHSFRIPRPDLSRITGAPDACGDCHADRGADWAAARIAEHYPQAAARPHFGVALAHGRGDPASAAGELAALALDGVQPGIARATALWLLENSGDAEAADRVAPLLSDPDPLVRAAAVGAQRSAAAPTMAGRLFPALRDPSRSVRQAAARALLDAPIARMPPAREADLNGAMREWRASLASRPDFPETHLQMAGMALTMRNFPAAEAGFREAVRLDPQRIEAWTMIARIAAATRGGDAARAAVEEALRANPGDPGLIALREQAARLP